MGVIPVKLRSNLSEDLKAEDLLFMFLANTPGAHDLHREKMVGFCTFYFRCVLY